MRICVAAVVLALRFSGCHGLYSQPDMKRVDMSPKQTLSFDLKSFLAKEGEGKTLGHYQKDEHIFAQGDLADAIFYIHSGRVKLTVNSDKGKEAVIAILEPGNYFGEGCLAGQKVRMSTGTALSESSILRLAKALVVRLLQEEPA